MSAWYFEVGHLGACMKIAVPHLSKTTSMIWLYCVACEYSWCKTCPAVTRSCPGRGTRQPGGPSTRTSSGADLTAA